jgi:hypothetical protein
VLLPSLGPHIKKGEKKYKKNKIILEENKKYISARKVYQNAQENLRKKYKRLRNLIVYF